MSATIRLIYYLIYRRNDENWGSRNVHVYIMFRAYEFHRKPSYSRGYNGNICVALPSAE